MPQVYSNPQREAEEYALPDCEVFFHQHAKRELCALNAGYKAELYGECVLDEEGDCLGTGWYYWSCFPGCLPGGDPFGPYDTQEIAIADCRDTWAD